MAEPAAVERLQPSLLDRLTDDTPEATQEGREKRIMTPAQLRRSVERDLGWLLNAVHLEAAQSLEAYPEVARSVVNYGMWDLTGRTVSSIKAGPLEQHLAQVIRDFEPRLLPGSIKVRLVVDQDLMSHNAMRFDIQAELWAQPIPLHLFLRTEIDLESGTVQVTEGDRGGR